MRKFFRQILAAALGIILVMFSMIILVGFFATTSSKTLHIKAKSVLDLTLCGTLVEHITDTSLYQKEISLLTLKEAIETAKEDRRIQGIYLKADNFQVGWAALEELRASLINFKKSGKFIVAYGTNYTQKSYYLAALADNSVIHPSGVFRFQGLSVTCFFYKGLLEKLAVKPVIFRVGTYKNAVEPFLLDSISKANKVQIHAYLNSIYSHYIKGLSTDRTISTNSLKQMANTLSVVLPQDAYKANLFSEVGYEHDAEQLIKKKLNFLEKVDLHKVPFRKYVGVSNKPIYSKNKVAVIIAEGDIIDSQNSSGKGIISAHHFSKMMQEIRADKDVKGVVLRINSPGGNSLASDVMWKEIELTKVVKPVVASMSDCAASGGYYIAAPCNYIFAHPTTITGSIGIFGLFFDCKELLHNCGITSDVVKTSESADLLDFRTTLTVAEQKVVQKTLNVAYRTFLEKVSIGRQLNIESVEKLAGGRVYTGMMACKNGLVDEIGGLTAAINMTAKLATIEQKDYTICYFPKKKNLLATILSNFTIDLFTYCFTKVAAQYPLLKHYQQLNNMQGIQARLPYDVSIE